MSDLYQRLLDQVDDIDTALQLNDAIGTWLDALDDLPGWQFDPESEAPAMAALAARKPDTLVQSVYLWNRHLAERNRRPRSYQSDLPAMKRAVAEALAPLYPDGRAPRQHDPLRVAIFAPWLPNNPNNNILRVLAGYLGGLLSLGVDARLVISNEMSFPDGVSVLHGRTDPRPYRAMLDSVIGEYGAPAQALHMAPPPFLDEGNLAWHLGFQREFQADVIFVPNFEMSSAHIHGFGRAATTVYLQTSVRNRPSYDFDRYLYLGAPRQIDDSHIHPGKWHYHSFGYGNFGAGAGLTRGDIGLPENALVVVTAGNRLENEVNAELAGIMQTVMRDDPRVVWMLLGVKDETKIHDNLGWQGTDLPGRVICKGYVREIGDYLSLSDLYANPRRTGGAVSMALAVYGHTPVLSFVGNDACNFLVDEMMHDTPEAYGAKLAELVADPDALNRVDAEQRARFEAHHTIEASACDLLGHFQVALGNRVPA